MRLFLIGLSGLLAASAAFSQLAAKPAPASPSPIQAKVAPGQPLWKELTAKEQTALSPLSAEWDEMRLGQKNKWLSVAKDFDKLPAPQQTKMHARMREWTALSPQQRATARLNFAQHRELTDGLTPEQRSVQWQAYQQLSPEEKRKLADSAPKASLAGSAPPAKPQPVLRKEPAPEFGTAKVLERAKITPSPPATGKKITVAPHVASQGLILPGNPTPESASKP